MLRISSIVLGGLVIAVTVLGLFRSKVWWVRIWDFPRFQLAVLGTLALIGTVVTSDGSPWAWLVIGAVAAAVLYQAAHVWRYTRLAPLEVQESRTDTRPRLTVAVCNVLQTNRESDRLIGVLTAADADVLLFVETDAWWCERLAVLRKTHPYTVQCALSNTYGMVLYSRLPLLDTSIDFLIQGDIPSIQAQLRLDGTTTLWLNCVHPPPPAPGENDDSLERDAELLLVGKRVSGAKQPVVVCGDLNDVAWSRTTRQFQKASRLLDPRKGRGMFSTFHARFPGVRFPLDHIMHSAEFRFVEMRRLPYVGSDHFPVVATLSLEPDAAAEQEAPTPDAGDEQDIRETIADGRS